MGDKAASIDEYLDGVDPAFRAELERIRGLVIRRAWSRVSSAAASANRN